MYRIELLVSGPTDEVDVLTLAAAVDIVGDQLPGLRVHELRVSEEDA